MHLCEWSTSSQGVSYRDIMEILVKKRTKLEPIRLDLIGNESPSIRRQLLKHLKLSESQSFFNELPVLLPNEQQEL